jgi:hypothetical protein
VTTAVTECSSGLKLSLCLSMRHEGVWRSGCEDPRFLPLDTCRRRVVSFKLRALLHPYKKPQALTGQGHRVIGRVGAIPVIELRPIGRPVAAGRWVVKRVLYTGLAAVLMATGAVTWRTSALFCHRCVNEYATELRESCWGNRWSPRLPLRQWFPIHHNYKYRRIEAWRKDKSFSKTFFILLDMRVRTVGIHFQYLPINARGHAVA